MLNQTTILIRTAQGEEEIRSGKYDIMPNQRIALNFIDGKSSGASLLKKAAPSLRASLPGLLESLSIEGVARDISQPETNKGNLKIAIPLGKSTSSKKPKNLNTSGSVNKNKFATGLSDPPSARARERGADLGTWTETSTRARERGEDFGAWQDALTRFEENAQTKKKAPINAKVAEQTRIWEKAEAEEEARLWAEAAAKAKAENEAKDKAEVAAATKQRSKSRHKKGKKARLRPELQAKTSENTEKIQHEIDDEAKITAASEAYAKAVAMAEEEARATVGEINQKIENEAIEETETSPILPMLDVSTLESLDSEETLSNEIEAKDTVGKKASAEITSKAEVEIQDEEEARNETVTKKETWREKEDIAVSEVQITTTQSILRRQKPINLSLIVPLLLVILVSGVLLCPPCCQQVSTSQQLKK